MPKLQLDFTFLCDPFHLVTILGLISKCRPYNLLLFSAQNKVVLFPFQNIKLHKIGRPISIFYLNYDLSGRVLSRLK